jgi:hypothetical protein
VPNNKVEYQAPDEILVDAVYCYENGGINPVRHDGSVWKPHDNTQDNCITRYEKIRSARSCYQGFWEVPEDATKAPGSHVHP